MFRGAGPFQEFTRTADSAQARDQRRHVLHRAACAQPNIGFRRWCSRCSLRAAGIASECRLGEPIELRPVDADRVETTLRQSGEDRCGQDHTARQQQHAGIVVNRLLESYPGRQTREGDLDEGVGFST